MSVIFARATGNFLTAATWGLVDSTSFLRSESGSTVVPTSAGAGARSAGFTPGAITIDGIAVALAARSGTTGTITVRLWNNTDSVLVTGATCTINCSDLAAAVSTTTNDGGWTMFGFASVLLVVAKSYMVEVITSNASQVSLYTNGTPNNWSRALRTTTTQAPVAGDDMVVAGNWTAAGTLASYVVTMDQTAATDYGSNTTSTVTPAIAVSQGGTFKFKDTSAANPYLRVSGHVIVYNGGTLNDGTVATPIPRNSTSVFEFDCAADGDFGLIVRNGGTYTSQGLSRTSGKNVFMCLMTADASASGVAPSTSTLSVDTDTGWLSGDVVAVAATTRTNTQCEYGTLNADAGASSIVVKNMTTPAAGDAIPPTSNRGLINAHSGTSPTQAEVVLISRNVKLRSSLATAMTFVQVNDGAIVDIDWTEFYYVGTGSTGKFSVNLRLLGTAAWNFSMQFSSIHTTESDTFCSFVTSQTITEFTFSNNVLWNMGGSAVLVNSAMTATNYTISGNIAMRNRASNTYAMADVGGAFANNRAIGSVNAGISLTEGSVIGTWSGNIAHSNGGDAFAVSGAAGDIFGDLGAITGWRNGGTGLFIAVRIIDGLSFQPTMFGNTTDNILLATGGLYADVTINSPVLNGDSTFSTTNGIRTSTGTYNIRINNGDLSSVSGIKTAHTNDINVSAVADVRAVIHNTKLGAATQVTGVGFLSRASYISAQKLGQVAGAHQTWTKYGISARDAVTFNTAAPSQKLTPNSASNKLESATKDWGEQVAVNSGDTVNASVSVRKSGSYNGNQPRLIVRMNYGLGITVDTVLGTYASGTGSFNTLSGTTIAATDDGVMEFIVDCDGTAGDVNVDDWAFT